MKRLRATVILLLMLLAVASIIPPHNGAAQAWVAIAAYADSNGALPSQCAWIGALGVYSSVLHGAAWGAAFGLGVGALAGAAVGL